jgi:rifampicin phosphotransferase
VATMDHPSDDCPVARLIGRHEVPAGSWSRPVLLFPYAVTPLCADFALAKHLLMSYRAAGEELSVLTPHLECLVVDGWVYTRLATAVDHSPARVAAFEAKAENRYDEALLRRWRKKTRPAAVARLRRYQRLDLHRLSDADLLRHIHQLSDEATELLTAHNQNLIAAHQIMYRCARFCEQQFDLGPAAFVDLLTGSSVASSEPVRRMEELAVAVLDDSVLRDALASPASWANPKVCTLLEPWLEEYGHRLPAFEYIFPTPAERPDQVVRLLREAIVRQQSAMQHGEDLARHRQATVTSLRNQLSPAVRATFDRLLQDARTAYAVRDDTIGIYQWSEGLLRYALLEAGHRLSARGLLTMPERVWYLRRPELEGALAGNRAGTLRDRAEHRHAEHQRQQANEPPIRLRVGEPVRPPALPPLSDEAQQAVDAQRWFARLRVSPAESGVAEERELCGAPASGGIYRGVARVLHSEDGFNRVQPGDVLVCPTTSPTWNILFGTIGAVVTDEGGILSHPAIIAREFVLPAVVGTRSGTKVIADGQIVEVDGTAGIVRF